MRWRRPRRWTSTICPGPAVLLEEGHCLRDQALEACHLEGLKNEKIRATSLETLRQMVGMGLGVTLMPVRASGASSRRVGTWR